MATFPGWTAAVLGELGAPPTPGNVSLLGAWARAEGGGARFNPLNTTQPAAGATDYNSAGVKNYPSAASGAHATAQTLLNGFYSGIVRDLRAGTVRPLDIVNRNASQFDKWGTGASHVAAALGGSVSASSSSAAGRSRPGGGILGGIEGAAGGILGAITGPADFFRFLIGLLDPHNWLRAVELLLGAGLIFSALVGYLVLFAEGDSSSSSPAKRAARGAVRAVPATRTVRTAIRAAE